MFWGLSLQTSLYVYLISIFSFCLQYMSQIKEKQQERERGDWTNMPEAQRHQEEANLTQISRMAQYHNIMGLATISTLNMITTEVKSIFCHSTFVDRMASMLNYFLVKLVSIEHCPTFDSQFVEKLFIKVLSWIVFSFRNYLKKNYRSDTKPQGLCSCLKNELINNNYCDGNVDVYIV